MTRAPRRLLVAAAILSLAGAGVALAQNSQGGAFRTAFNYVIGGQWTWRSQATPFVFEGTVDDPYEATITVSNPTADRAWTLPDTATPGSLVGTTATQTLTNKAVTSSTPTGGIGYATGAGCAVTQMTNRATGVTCTGLSGAITTDATSLAAEASAVFTVTNTSVAVGDVVLVAIRSGMVALNTRATVTVVAAGSFAITIVNGNVAAGTAETGAIIINFAVIKAVSA